MPGQEPGIAVGHLAHLHRAAHRRHRQAVVLDQLVVDALGLELQDRGDEALLLRRTQGEMVLADVDRDPPRRPVRSYSGSRTSENGEVVSSSVRRKERSAAV